MARRKSILHAGRRYDRNLALARAGVLPFFVVASIVVFLWARRIGGWPTGAAAVALFTTLPPVLGHAGVATTDMAITATLVLAAYCAIRWLDEPSVPRGLLLGMSLAAALLSKFSALLFLPAGAAAIALVRWRTRHARPDEPSPRPGTKAIRAVYLAALLTVWAGYRFSIGPLVPPPGTTTTATPSQGPLENLAQARVFPAPAFFEGLGEVAAKNRAGHKSYLLGEVRDTGWWYFFPVALAVKTPLAFVLLVVAGIFAAVRMPLAGDRARHLIPLAIAVAILLVCLPSRINIGLRHVLPLYPFLAITAGAGVVAWRASAARRPPALSAPRCWRGGRWRHPLARIRTTWRTSTSWRVTSRNGFCGQRSGRRTGLEATGGHASSSPGAGRVARLCGSATVSEHGLPPYAGCSRTSPSKAGSRPASIHSSWDRWNVRGTTTSRGSSSYEPVTRVGRSIRLYYIP